MQEPAEIEAVRARASSRRVAERHGVRLRSAGGGCWRGPCPLPGHRHREGDASSFKVHAKGGWECSDCGLAGPDGISLEQAITGLDFTAAVQALAEALQLRSQPVLEARSSPLAACLRIALQEPPAPTPSSPTSLARFNILYTAREALAEAHDIIIQARALVLCGLPYRRVDLRSVVRRARLAPRSHLTVTFTAVDPEQPLPFGADRALLGWIQTLAYRSPQIRFSSLTEFFRAFGLADSGREYRVFHERLARLRGLAISVQLASEEGDHRVTMHPIKRSFLPGREEAQTLLGSEDEPPRMLAPRDYGFELDPDFYESLRANPIPLPLPVMRAFHNSPKAWDFASFVLYRSFAARTISILPWSELLQQIGSEDAAHRRLKATLAGVLAQIRVLYPDFPPRFLPGRRGLLIEPWRPPKAAEPAADARSPARAFPAGGR
jgi:Plasmid encoded RepA protein